MYLEQRLPSFYVCIKHEEILLNADSDSKGLRLNVWLCISIRLESDADAAGAWTTRWVAEIYDPWHAFPQSHSSLSSAISSVVFPGTCILK